METTHLKFDALPAEIIQRIASIGRCESVLALVRVNRALRRVCNDRHVFRSIIRNRSCWGSSNWPDIPLTSADSTSAWARYALADSKAATIEALSSAGLVKWGPQLMTSHHPVLHEHRNANVLYHFATEGTRDVNHKAVLFFCFALRVMSQSPPNDVAQPGLLPVRQTPNSAFPPPRQELRQKLMNRLSWQMFYYKDEEPWWCPERNMAAFLKVYCQALEVLGIISVRIREELAKGTIRETDDLGVHNLPAPPVQISVPTTESIRFQNRMDMPLPFAADIATTLPFCHLAKMTSKEFLEEGEWAGFSSLCFDNTTRTLDPPIRNIRFQASNDPELPAWNLQARGEDGFGSFRLLGKMALKTGETALEKQYDGQVHTSQWVCVMKPFGLVGTWGREDWLGWVWFWKV